jgi:hypothetical protein
MNKTHGLEVDDWLSPTDIYSFLSKFGNDSPLRRRLSDPREIIEISKRIVAMLESLPSNRTHQAVAKYVATGEAPKAFADKNWMLQTFRHLILKQIESDIAADLESENSPA